MNQTSGNYSDLTIIIPTLNEEKTISLLLSKIEVSIPYCNVIVSDDGSNDNTKKLVEGFEGKNSICFLDRKHERIHGLTISVLDAIMECSTSFFLVMDGDLQHPTESIPQFYEELKQGYDLVAGNRVQVIGKWPLHRKFMSYVARFLGNLSLFIRRKNSVKDIMTGLFASRSDIWKHTIEKKKTDFIQEGYKVLFDFLKLYKEKLKVSHVNYVFGTRNFGESKINNKVIWMFFKSLF
ncbi:MAG: glycosyltransferase [Candidatus Heimdallarchaeota archaeon]|nr:glycosyltransferase [Candidatus Heimdallarchaeota archaeon]